MRLGKDVKDKLEQYLDCHEDTRTSPLIENARISKLVQKSGPRFIWFQEQDDNVCVYVLRAIYNHDDYLRKVNDTTKHAWYQSHQLTEEEKFEVRDFIESKKPKTELDPLPQEYLQYEDRPRGFEQKKEVIVYELPEWANGYQDVDDKFKESVYHRLVELVDNDYSNYSQDSDGYGFMLSKINGYELCVRMESNNTGDNKVTAYYLLQVSSDEVDTETLHEHKYDCPNASDLMHKSVKCYPDFILYDFKVWDPLEDDSDANLALSSEELRILQNIEYPFFVSGLAGSGKSTILYYLFAHAYNYEHEHWPGHKLLFLSYSKKLVSQARKIVKSILLHHPSYGMQEDVNDSAFDRCFVPFQDFIKGEFLDNTDNRRFSRDKYIDYQVFKTCYESCKLPEKKKYSADIVWSVIRTFIKGKDGSHYFTPEEYRSNMLSYKDRTVTPEDYDNIYKIWYSWYRHLFEDEEKWDDLDLVRYALGKSGHTSHFHQYAIVFCDEAQDFTKVETDLILKLSVHSKYDLTVSPEAAKIPIAFAGDPNQTVNPTGFRWGSTQEIFNLSFSQLLKQFKGFMPNELHTNYRSREGIVKFANTIQYLRHRYLSDGKQSMNFQKAWDSDSEANDTESVSYVAFYNLGKNTEEIKKALHKTVIITPDEGEYVVEDSTVKGDTEDALLLYTQERKRALGIPDEVPNERLYTAITSKGLEFKSVILYRFGSDKAVDLFPKILNDKKFDDDSELYNLAHFFTKLYIAISRAKQVLFIVDTQEGYNKFWRYFIDKSCWAEFTERLVNDKSYMPHMGPVSMGNLEDFVHLLDENYKPKEYAESLFKNALDEENKDTMNRARSAYKDAHYEDKAMLCEAYMYKFDHKYLEAGNRFERLGRTKEAIDCYWDGQLWSDLIAEMHAHSSLADGVRLAIARYMAEDKETVQTFLKEWMKNESVFQESITNEEYRDVWNSVLDKVVEQAARLEKVQITEAFIKQLDYLHDYFLWYRNGMKDLRADLHFKRAQFSNRGKDSLSADFEKEDYRIAIELWNEDGDHSKERPYLLAQKYTAASISDRIFWMQRLGEGDDILKEYGDPKTAPSLSENAQAIIFSLLISKNFNKALDYPFPKEQEAKWSRLYTQDRMRFVSCMAVDHLSLQLYSFLQTKIDHEETSVFETKMPSEVYESIFSSHEKDGMDRPLWVSFATSLKNINGERVFKAKDNRLAILNVLANLIQGKDDHDNHDYKMLASCMIELLFDDCYDRKRAERYMSAIKWIFSNDMFFKEDFRGVTQRNRYFALWCNLTGEQLDTIKDNIRRFATANLDALKSTKANDEMARILFRAIEIAAPYQGTAPDYQYVVNTYTKRRKNYKEAMLKWIDGRIALNILLDEASLQRASFTKFAKRLTDSKIALSDVAAGFTREDAAAFVAVVNTQNTEYSFDATLATAQLLHSKRLRRANLMPYCRVYDLLANLGVYVRTAIEEILSEQRINEAQLKFITFVWEALYDDATAAANYDELLDKKRSRLAPLTRLVEYLEKRALLHYSYLKQSLFRAKQEEYGISMTKDYLPATYPKIENEVVFYTEAGRNGRGNSDNGFAPKPAPSQSKKQTPNDPNRQQPSSHGTPSDANGGPVHDRIVNIAKNLKKMGMTANQISEATGLSVSEIEKI